DARLPAPPSAVVRSVIRGLLVAALRCLLRSFATGVKGSHARKCHRCHPGENQKFEGGRGQAAPATETGGSHVENHAAGGRPQLRTLCLAVALALAAPIPAAFAAAAVADAGEAAPATGDA